MGTQVYHEQDLVRAVLITLFIAVVLGAIACFRVNMNWKAEAVKNGHAKYYLDENNSRQWRWLDDRHHETDR